MKKTGFTISFEDGETHTRYLTPKEKYNVFLDETNKTIEVKTKFLFYGNYASEEIAKLIIKEVKTHYNKSEKIEFKNSKYKVTFTITYSIEKEVEALIQSKKNTDPILNFVRLEKSSLRSFYLIGNNSGFLVQRMIWENQLLRLMN